MTQFPKFPVLFSSLIVIVSAVLLLPLSSPASLAASAKSFSVQQWTGGANFNLKSKQFENCSASSKNDAGIAISYSVDRSFNWKLAFSNANWDFTTGHRLRVTIRTGDEDFRDLGAIATNAKTLEVQVSDPLALFERLRANRSMRIQAGGLKWDLPTLDSNDVMATLVSCVLQQTPRVARTKSNTTDSGKPLQLAPSTDPRGEARAIAASMLGQISLTGYQLAAGSVSSPTHTGIAWRKDTISGTVFVTTDRKWDPAVMPHEILSRNNQPCQGHLFVVATADTIDQTPVARSFVSCRDIGDVVSTYYLSIPRAAGGFYQIATIKSGFELGPRRLAEDLDLKIRSIIVGVIAKHGSAQP